jgi:hypothetical protein
MVKPLRVAKRIRSKKDLVTKISGLHTIDKILLPSCLLLKNIRIVFLCR